MILILLDAVVLDILDQMMKRWTVINEWKFDISPDFILKSDKLHAVLESHHSCENLNGDVKCSQNYCWLCLAYGSAPALM